MAAARKVITLGEMPGRIRAAKRVRVKKSDWLAGWYVGHGKDESCQIEGTANHWNWLALIILGLADPNDAPYDEDKPLPVDPAEVRAALSAMAAARKALLAVRAACRDPDTDTALPSATGELVEAALAAMGERS
ncbi:UNVERIFIED_CONTAM: hypothetical protein Q9R58_22350 [Methylobacteriaceae bacterium AG10]|nr:hypothetical protein [Methylobacteriaceae bacterium AG10]